MKRKHIVISVFALINIICVPVFDVWGGLFPSNPDENFFYVIEEIFSDIDAWGQWIVMITMSVFIPSVIMFISVIVKSHFAFKVSSLMGLVSLGGVLLMYMLQNEPYDYIPSDDCNISIGTWIALTIFIISVKLAFKKKENNENHSPAQTVRICHNCGIEVSLTDSFCGKCGQELKFDF